MSPSFRARWVAPVAVLGAGCAVRPFTSSLTVVHWAEAVPDVEVTVLPGVREAIDRWMPVDSAWYAFAKATLLGSLAQDSMVAMLPDVARLDVVRRARLAAARVAMTGIPPRTMLVVDLRGAGSVAFGAQLSRTVRQPVVCLPTFNHWPDERELIPAEETLAAMLRWSPRLPAPHEEAAPVMLLDAWRLAYRDLLVDEETVDNRYALNPGDLPDAALLKLRGIDRVVYVVEDLDEAQVEEDDLNASMLEWREAGVAISMVDLDWFARLEKEPDWARALAGYALEVKPRRTVFDEREFYARARGGFGGANAGPSPFRTDVVMGGHFHGGWFGGGGGGRFAIGSFGGGRGGFGG